jgi:hypothetical protein
VVRTDPYKRFNEQAIFRTCSKCSVLMALKTPDGSAENPCAAGGAHTPTGEYFLTTVTSDPYWHWCSKCPALAYWDMVNPPGPCPAGGLHEHGSSWLYTVPRLDGQVTELLAAALQPGQSYVNPAKTVTFNVVSFGSGGAIVQVNNGGLFPATPPFRRVPPTIPL